ncbi:hypothetical protein D1F64_04865 [Breoghania sp. L-A4]|nr:hypothetical protein D1F64_04865 [Breoghania sp. L-A4]
MRGRAAARAGALAGLLLLGACGSSDGPPGAGNPFLTGDFSGGKIAEENKPVDPTLFERQKFCPQVEVRGDSHLLTVYARGQEDDPSGLRYQATIREWARECFHSGDMVTIKVGVIGRVVSGPAGVDGAVDLPLRIAVTGDEDAVLASELVPVAVAMTAASGTQAWNTVVDSITVPAAGASRIYIGFDEEAGRKRR